MVELSRKLTGGRTVEVQRWARVRALERPWTLKPHIEDSWRVLREALDYLTGWWVPDPTPAIRPDRCVECGSDTFRLLFEKWGDIWAECAVCRRQLLLHED